MKYTVCMIGYRPHSRSFVITISIVSLGFVSYSGTAFATTLLQSSNTHADEIQVYTPTADGLNYYNHTERLPILKLGVWNGDDFTIDASTTIHLWAHWNGRYLNWLPFKLSATTGGTPFYGKATTTAIIAANSLGLPAYIVPVDATSTLKEYVIPTVSGQTINHGNEIWAEVYTSYSSPAYGANHWLGGIGDIPQNQICEAACDQESPPCQPVCTEDCNSNVMFLHGIEGSRLFRPDYAGGTEQLWEPLFQGNQKIRDLYLSDDGKGMRDDVYAKEHDVIDELPATGENIYKSFIAKMDDLRAQGRINDWEPIAYDWRLSVDDNLDNGNDEDGRIYYTGLKSATSTPYIVQELRRLAASSKTGKVTIIAHSNGGLLAKRLTEDLGDEASKLIDKMIFVAVPQVGTPEAVYDGLHGGVGVGPDGLVGSPSVVRAFASTSPMFYQLLPSAQYFTYVDNPVVTFGPLVSGEWVARYGDTIHSEERLSTFLTDPYGRVDAETGRLEQPVQLKSSLLANAQALHDDLDNWTPPEGIQLIQIAGWGVPSTISGITYVNNKTNDGITPEVHTTIDGDGTVVVPSALWTSTSTGATNYWVNLEKLNKVRDARTGFGIFPYDHGRILESQEVITLITDNLLNTERPTINQYISTSSPQSSKTRLSYELHSPLTLDAYDDAGNHTGMSTTTGQLEEQIPGTYYAAYGDVKYLFTDPETPIHVVMSGYATSTFTFEAQELQGNTLVASTTWRNMPVTPQTQVTIDQPSDFSSLAPLKIDTNGDGVTDYSIAPVSGAVIDLPKVPLTIAADDKTITLGASLPKFTATLSGFITGEPPATSDITGEPTCTTAVADTHAAGSYPITCTIGTLSSNTYEFKTFTPGVLHITYRMDGFLPPISVSSTDVSAHAFKAGSTIPVKFQLKGANGVVVQANTLPAWLSPVQLGPIDSTTDVAVYSDSATSGLSYRWDAGSQQYIYNWSTKGYAAGYWYRVSAKADDGTIYSIVVGLK